jgi:hypothetical protein
MSFEVLGLYELFPPPPPVEYPIYVEDPPAPCTTCPSNTLGTDPGDNTLLPDEGTPINPSNVVKDSTITKNPRVNCVYEKLRTSSSLFNISTGNFMNFGNQLNLKFKIGHVPQKVNHTTSGITNPVPPNVFHDFEIVLDSTTMANVSPIEIAKTILHEAIHAMIHSHIALSGAWAGAPADSIKKNFPALIAYFDKAEGTVNHHNYMAEWYLNYLTQALYELFPPPTGSGLTWNHYQALAWEGLHETTMWEKKSKTEQDAIKAMAKLLKDSLPNTCP